MALGGIIGGIVGSIAGADDRRGARDMMSQAWGAFNNIKVPTVEEQQIMLKLLESQGQLTPELEAYVTQKGSRLSDYKSNPKLVQAQMDALKSLQETGRAGFTAEDRAAVNQLKLNLAQAQKGNEQAIMQNLAQRGMAGSGQELAQKLAASQNSADQAMQQGDTLAAQMLQRKLQAIAQSGQLGGQIEQQNFGEQQGIANAEDAINKFNTQNTLDVNKMNIGYKNTAQAQNLAEKQRIADTNIGLQNQQEIHNKALIQQKFMNDLAKAQGVAGIDQAVAAANNAESNRKAQMGYGIGSGVDQMAAALFTGAPGAGGGSSGGIDYGTPQGYSGPSMANGNYYSGAPSGGGNIFASLFGGK